MSTSTPPCSTSPRSTQPSTRFKTDLPISQGWKATMTPRSIRTTALLSPNKAVAAAVATQTRETGSATGLRWTGSWPPSSTAKTTLQRTCIRTTISAFPSRITKMYQLYRTCVRIDHSPHKLTAARLICGASSRDHRRHHRPTRSDTCRYNREIRTKRDRGDNLVLAIC